MEINHGIHLLKYDEKVSKYNGYINTLPYKIKNITDPEIIKFYDISILPTIFILYKDEGLLYTIEGVLTKSELIEKINELT